MGYPQELKYTKDHEWVRHEGQEALVGITAYALEQLSDVVHLDLPSVGASFDVGATFGTIESTKTVSDLYMPVKGKIVAINSGLLKQLESLNQDPYVGGWLVRIAVSGGGDLLSAKEYEAFIGA